MCGTPHPKSMPPYAFLDSTNRWVIDTTEIKRHNTAKNMKICLNHVAFVEILMPIFRLSLTSKPTQVTTRASKQVHTTKLTQECS